MSTQVKEMDDGYADGGYTSMSVVDLPAVPAPPTGFDDDDSVAMGDPVPAAMDAKSVTVYANSINPISYNSDDAVCAFDVVFSVGIVCPDTGNSETYQVVKRIGVDRLKIAEQAKMTTPVSIVEAKKIVPIESQFGIINTARYKALAGIK